MRAGSLGWAEAIRKMQLVSGEGGGVLLPAPSTEIAAPQDAKLSALAPEPSEQPFILAAISETRHLG